MRTTAIKVAPLVALIAAGCGGISHSNADDFNQGMPSGGTGGNGGTAGTGVMTSGTGGTGAVATGGTGAAVATGGTGAVATGGAGGAPLGGTGGAEAGGSAGSRMETGGGAGMTGGSGGTAPVTAYSPREGTFKMLIYSRTGPVAFRHDDSITSGIQMLQQIASEQGFEATATETNTDITVEGLSQYEIVFFMNPAGDIFNDTEQEAFEEWMTTKNGAFGGVHSATDTEPGWAFYSEVTGQYHSGHGFAGTTGAIQFDAAMLGHPALVGLPNPWQRNEEWFLFDNFQQWSTKPGFQILGRKRSDDQPIMWIREWGNFRSFYTALGHSPVVFQDAAVKKHVTGGIMWAVRRDHLIR